jgi:integrase/recombinase XerD
MSDLKIVMSSHGLSTKQQNTFSMMNEKTRVKIEWIEKRLKKFDETAAVLEKSIDGYLKWMALNGYTQSTRKNYKYALDQFLSFIKYRRYTWDETFAQDTIMGFKKIRELGNIAAVTGLSRYLFQQGRIAKPIHTRKPPPPLPAFYEEYLLYQQQYRQTPDQPIKHIRRVLCAFEHYLRRHRIKLRTLRIEHIDGFHSENFIYFSDNTRRVYRSHLRGLLSYLFHERRILTRDLAPLVTGAAMFAQNNPPKFLRPGEIKRLFAGLKLSTASELRSNAMVHLAYLLGIRPCEICLLTLDDILFGKSEIRLRHRKNDRPATLPLPEQAIKLIAAYLVGGRAKSEHRNLFLTLHPPYRQLSPNIVGRCIGKCMKAAAVPGTAYWLRHTYAQNLLEAGLSIYEVKEMLGHTSIESTRRYLHIHIKLMREVLFNENF